MKRLMTGVLVAALLLSQTSIADVFMKTDAATVTAAEQDAEFILSAFIELPDDIKVQSVPVGTALYELELPDTLEAVCVALDVDTDADADTDEDTDIGDDADVNTDVDVDVDTDTDADVDSDVDTDTDTDIDAGNDTETNADTYTDTDVIPDDTTLLSGDGIMPIAEEHEHDGITFTAWEGTTSLPDSGSYYLVNDVTLSSPQFLSGSLTLCLNGHTITFDGLPIWVQSGRTLGIYDCQGNGAVTTPVSHCIRIDSGGTANIYGGTFNGANGADAPTIYVDGTVTIENASVFGQQAVQIDNNGMATINGGTFESTVAGYPTIELLSGSATKISGGTFIHKKGSNVIQNNQGTLEMSGGTVIGRSSNDRGSAGIVNYGRSATAAIKNVTITTEGTYADDDTHADKGLRNDNGGTMTVENCNITSSNWAVWNTITPANGNRPTIKISGGTFNGRYGIYNNNGKFELSGSPTFAGSTADIYLSNNQKITVTGNLGNAAPYSVLTETAPAVGRPVEITDSSDTNYNNADKFTPANNSYILRKNISNQLELAVLAHTHDDMTFTPWTSDNRLPTSAGSYYLQDDVMLSTNKWTPQENITLCLNGHTITYSGTTEAVRSNSGITIGIYDCQDGGTIGSFGRVVFVAPGGTANIYGGTFKSYSTNSNLGSTIYNWGNGKLNIYGGTFENTSDAPTIELDVGTSTIITGGNFINNNGSNVIQNQGTLEVSGGTVIGKSRSTRGVIGIFNYGSEATAEIKNVTIITEGTDTDNDTLADKGVCNTNGGIMIVESCDITSSSRAVWNTGASTIKINGGTFQGQYGIHNASGTFELSGSPTFIGSTADIYLSNNQRITITGTLDKVYSVLTSTNPTSDNPVVFTTGSTTYNDKENFTAADSSYIVRKNSSDQLELVVPETYAITYDKGTGSDITGSVPSGTKTEGVDFTLSSQIFTRAGYTQAGWSTTDGGAKVYDLGGTYSTDASITLYPYWTANEYDITYMDQGGATFSGTHESGYPTKHAYGTATTLKSASKTGYTFGGWYMDSSCTGSTVTSLGATDYTSDITLYAKWTEDIVPPKTDGGSSSGSGNGSQSSGNNSGGTGTGNNAASGTQTSTDTSGNTQTSSDTTGGTQSDMQNGTGTRNGRGNSTGTNRAGASSSSSAGNTDNKDRSQSAPADTATDSTEESFTDTDQGAGQSDASGTDGQTTGSTAQTVKADLKDGKITVEGDVVVTGTVRTAETTTKTLIVGEGAVIVTVVSDEYKGNAGVADTVAVANAVLTPEQIQRVNDGEKIEIRVEVTDISAQVSQEDKDIIENGLADYKITGDIDGQEHGELILGAYIDISMYIKIGDGDWDAITRADEPIEVVIGIPDDLLSDGRTYYIARAHEGEYALLEDMDNEPDTITIKTGMFSTYAIVFKQIPGAGADASSGFLASLSWTAVALWSLGILVMIALAVILILGKRRKEEEDAS